MPGGAISGLGSSKNVADTGNDRKLLMGLCALAIAMGLNLSSAQAQDADRFPRSDVRANARIGAGAAGADQDLAGSSGQIQEAVLHRIPGAQRAQLRPHLPGARTRGSEDHRQGRDRLASGERELGALDDRASDPGRVGNRRQRRRLRRRIRHRPLSHRPDRGRVQEDARARCGGCRRTIRSGTRCSTTATASSATSRRPWA